MKAAAGRWVFLPDGRQYLVPPGRAIPPGSHPLPQLLAAPERAKSNGGGILGFLEKHLVEPLEEGAPIVAPYAAASVVTAFCPECSVLAALAAGGASFGVHKGIEHEQTGAALREAVLEFMGTRAQDALKKAIGRKVDELLVRNQTAAALAVVQAALANERDYDAAVAFHHR